MQPGRLHRTGSCGWPFLFQTRTPCPGDWYPWNPPVRPPNPLKLISTPRPPQGRGTRRAPSRGAAIARLRPPSRGVRLCSTRPPFCPERGARSTEPAARLPPGRSVAGSGRASGRLSCHETTWVHDIGISGLITPYVILSSWDWIALSLPVGGLGCGCVLGTRGELFCEPSRLDLAQ